MGVVVGERSILGIAVVVKGGKVYVAVSGCDVSEGGVVVVGWCVAFWVCAAIKSAEEKGDPVLYCD